MQGCFRCCWLLPWYFPWCKSTETQGTEVGEYKTTLSLINPEKYEWDTETNRDGGWEYTWKIIENKPKSTVTDGNTKVSIEGVGGTTFDPSAILEITRLEDKILYKEWESK